MEEFNRIESYWKRFLKAKKLDSSTKYNSVFAFGNDEQTSNRLCQLVLDNKKKATAALLKSYEACDEIPPNINEYSIVTDFKNNPKCVIQTSAIIIIPFNQMTYEICKKEAEDETLESWKEGHSKFFSQDAQELGFEFDENMEVFFQEFEVVYHENDVC